jgi:hypothetical protein
LEKALEQPNPIAFEVGTLLVSIRDLESRMKAADKTLQRNLESILAAKQKATLEMIKNATAQAEALRRTGLLASEPEHYQFEHYQIGWEKSDGLPTAPNLRFYTRSSGKEFAELLFPSLGNSALSFMPGHRSGICRGTMCYLQNRRECWLCPAPHLLTWVR